LMQAPLLRLFANYQHAYPDYYEIRVLLPDGYEDTRLTVEGLPNLREDESDTDIFKAMHQSPDDLYTEIFRNIPFLVQLFFWYYAGPMIFGEDLGRQINRIMGLNFYVAILALGFYTASRVAEHMRAGFASISTDQYQAVLSTGMTHYQMYRYVIIPYALRIILPPLTTEFLTIFKNSSVAMTIGVAELTFMSYRIDAETFHGLEATSGAMLIYLILGLTVVQVMSIIEAKFKIPGMIGR